MKILVIGLGGREAAIVQKLLEDESTELIVCAPGSDGIAALDRRVSCFPDVKATDLSGLLRLVQTERLDLTIVGPEEPLVAGIVDLFTQAGRAIVGPSQAAAQIEGSKVWCKRFLQACGVPTAPFAVFDDPDRAKEYVNRHGVPIVVKADGLAAGKGVRVARSEADAFKAIEAIMVRHEFGEKAGRQVVIDDCLTGIECSLIVLTDGTTVLPLAPAKDYKPVHDHDEGENTGGMGCYSPVPALTPALHDEVMQTILLPTVRALRKKKIPYRGILYAGLMLTKQGPKVLEFNCRGGDPETQVILARLASPLLPLLQATIDGTLHRVAPPVWREEKAVCLVLAAEGYPKIYAHGLPIKGLSAAAAQGVQVLHAGTRRLAEGSRYATVGGRVLNLLALDKTFAQARAKVYDAAQFFEFGHQKPHYRMDIAEGVR